MNIKTTLAALSLASLAFGAQAGWKEDMRKAAQAQAQTKMEKELGLPQVAPAGAKAYFVNLKDGDTVSNPVFIQFGLHGMGVSPAGNSVEGSGHFHLLIDEPTVDYTTSLPVTDQIKHFGGGQTETEITLKPGKHSLQLLMADWKHQPHNPAVQSMLINVIVKDAAPAKK